MRVFIVENSHDVSVYISVYILYALLNDFE